MMEFEESYGRLEDSDRSFDRAFWQRQGPEAIFKAAYGMVMDHLLLKNNFTGEPEIQRCIESYGKSRVSSSTKPKT